MEKTATTNRSPYIKPLLSRILEEATPRSHVVSSPKSTLVDKILQAAKEKEGAKPLKEMKKGFMRGFKKVAEGWANPQIAANAAAIQRGAMSGGSLSKSWANIKSGLGIGTAPTPPPGM